MFGAVPMLVAIRRCLLLLLLLGGAVLMLFFFFLGAPFVSGAVLMLFFFFSQGCLSCLRLYSCSCSSCRGAFRVWGCAHAGGDWHCLDH